MKYNTIYNKGFTLVEMIVSLALFTIVALVAVGAFLKITDANKKSQTLKTTINNLNFALESISREMRVGSNYYCITPAVTPGNIGASLTTQACDTSSSPTQTWVIAFNSSEKSATGSGCYLVHAYWFTNGTIKKAQQASCNDVLSQDNYSDLISPDVKITSSIVKVVWNNTTPVIQPRALIWISGYNGERERERTAFELQTTVSQRTRSI